MKTAFVTGAAGFIGSNLVAALLSRGIRVVGWDNFSTGQERFLEQPLANKMFRLVRGDNGDLPALTAAMRGCDFVFHLAANADVRFGTQSPRAATWSRTPSPPSTCWKPCAAAAFAASPSLPRARSTAKRRSSPRPRTARFPCRPSSTAPPSSPARALISAYCTGFGFQGFIFRFVSILGERYTHGHVFDFYNKLRRSPIRSRCWATASSANRTSTFRTASDRDAAGDRQGCCIRSTSSISAPMNTARWTTRSAGSATHLGSDTPSGAIPAASAAGSATTPSSSSTPPGFARLAGGPR